MKTAGDAVFSCGWTDRRHTPIFLVIQRFNLPRFVEIKRCMVSEIKELLAPKCNLFHTITDNRTEQNITERNRFANMFRNIMMVEVHPNRLLPGVEGTMARHPESSPERRLDEYHSIPPLHLCMQSSKSIVCYLATTRKLFTNNNQHRRRRRQRFHTLSCLCL
jgi:hypothetical protein